MVGSYDLESDSYFADPYETYARMRRDDPAYFDQARGIWFLTRYEDVSAVCRDKRMSVARADLFFAGVSPAMSEKTDVVRHFLTDWLNFVDPPRHTRLRKLQTPAFSARKIAALESYVQQVVDTVLDDLAGAGQFDLIRDFSFPVPAQIIAHMLGVPPEDLGSFKGWTDEVFRMLAWSGDPDENVAVAYDGVASLTAYFRDLIRARRKDPADDLLSALVEADEDGHFLTEDELVAACALLQIAGHETTTHLIGNAVIALLRHPDELARLRENPQLMASAVEEFLRYEGVSASISRLLLEDAELGGQVIPAGQLLFGVPQGANRDPAVFEDPDRFDVSRNDARHLAFAGGPHLCLGAALGRLETRIAVSSLLARFPDLALADDKLVWLKSLAIRGVESLPVTV